MAKTLQRLTERQALQVASSTGSPFPVATYDLLSHWSVSGGTISLSSDDFFVSNRYVLVINASSDTVTISTDASSGIFETDDTFGMVFAAVMKFKTNGVVTKTRIYQDSQVVNGNEKTHNAEIWSAVRSNVLTYSYSETAEVTAEVEISFPVGSENRLCYLTIPSVTNNDAFINAGGVLASKVYMPDFYWEFDGQSTSPTYPFFRFVDICTFPISEASQIYADWFEYENGELPYGTPRSDPRTKSRLLNPDAFFFEYRNWLWQFIGHPFVRNVYDASTNAPYVVDEEEYQRWQARTAHFGHGSGSRKAMREAVEFVLSGTKTVVITPKAEGDPFKISIKTLTSETPDVLAEGDVSQAVLQAAEQARPLGYQLIHEVVDEIIFTLGDIEQGILGTGQLG